MSGRILIHRPAHRRLALTGRDPLEAVAAYDRCIGAYLKFLGEEAAKVGYELRQDQHDEEPFFRIDAASRAQQRAIQAWLQSQPDIWNWMP